MGAAAQPSLTASDTRAPSHPAADCKMQPKSCRRGRATAHIARTDLYCGLVIVGFANGISERIGNEIHRHGMMTAVFNTYGVRFDFSDAAVNSLSLLLRA